MARRGRGGGKRGPDLSWDDEEDDPSTYNAPNRPAPQFPDIELPVPRPISAFELSCVKSYLRFRDRARNGPYYSVLDPSSLADPKTGKVIKRAGFDPFNDQEKYTAKYYKKKRTVPDLSGRDYELRYFPPELWPLLDPRRRHPLWKSTDIDFDVETNAPRKKRKRDLAAEEAINEDDENNDDDANNDTDGSDPLLSGARRSRNSTRAAKRRRDDLTTHKAGEKRGLDAEDEFSEEEIQPKPRRNRKDKNKGSDDEDDDEDDDNAGDDNDDADDDDDDDDDDGSADDEPVDSEFEESDDGGGDDYNAENYFDGGDGDDDDGFAYGGGRGGDDDGAYF
ncbi:hypothetical protein A1O1_08696 [Capronia coronata CBS 617.96]|uniref:DNA-directed RNA polymerase III subunit n=1 Tax=Capronia coronata CBS 617.96 TaxID=1182541 RepID=W9XT87_9EURO|nr:uncharacterized protein A1O1_08696 [Capronia coronata CBS 617.96]EXJ80550.1 hypothetical protein A1O1_08696 [Capronia coronata CBS 617.96]